MRGSPAVRPTDPLASLRPVETGAAAGLDDIERLAQAGSPVLLKGVVDRWPALRAARPAAEFASYLNRFDSGAPVPVMEAPPKSGGHFGYSSDIREFSFTKRSRPLGETLQRIAAAAGRDDSEFLAIQMLALDRQLPGFIAENPMPLVPSDARPKLWLGGPVKTQTHNDRDHNLACVLAGHRRFLLFPPDQVANLYIGPLDNPPPLSMVDPDSPDHALFPRFAEALSHAQLAFLGPGDALLMPRYWWHHVTSLDPYNAMVTYWWGGESGGIGDPYESFLAALLAFKSLPKAERAYWRAMLETHVFGDSGADHIPAAARGFLGSLTPALRASLKQRLRNQAIER